MRASDPGMTAEELRRAVLEKLFCMQAKFPEVATRCDYYLALAYSVRDLMLRRWIDTAHTYFDKQSRSVAYLSAEFLMGPQLGANLINLGIMEEARTAVAGLGLDLDQLLDEEVEPGLGNGGLGRLAACYMDSLATLAIPAIGYGIRYEFGIFHQEIQDGVQVELTDKWLRLGNAWEVARPQIGYDVKLGGHTEAYTDGAGRYRVNWVPHRVVKGTPYDTPLVGYGVRNVNMLRLWKAEACESFDFSAFNVGDYYRAVDEKVASENLTKVLYPNDEPVSGKILRLEQQYFFVSCSLQDLIRIHMQRQKDLEGFHLKWAIQLNDTHPALGIAELMRLLIDDHLMDWDRAWDITRQSFAYTNHTLLPEALETWPLALFERVLPRHLEIIYEINRRFLEFVQRRYPDDSGRIERLSLIGEAGGKRVRMANLACVGSRAINGVAALHTELLKATVLRDFHELWPEKFSNKTNGVTTRRFVILANPGLTTLISGAIGESWVRDLAELRRLEPLAEDAGFRTEWRRVKRANKLSLAASIRASTGLVVSPDSLFDVQAKRIHEYKRQHLNLLHIVTLYARLLRDPAADFPPRTFIFGGKAAPGYFVAKNIIRLINSVGRVVNGDARVKDRIKVVFFPNFNVKRGQPVYAAADLSEQISTAGKEASGTGNMKFALNGALTMGTLDGANVEIRADVGAENFFLFGLTEKEVARRWARGYRPGDELARDAELRAVIEMISSGAFSGGDRSAFASIVRSLVEHDEYLLFADYRSYVDCQSRASEVYADPERWTRMSILNVARMGRFSSDRAIREYCQEIWKVEPAVVVPRAQS
ncbi:MAG: glycogen/starch/alpha-glucan phosphorylase [Betaproteobacteria bacterium]|nr:glycogen/starch/alpha-glucan phosphorylase [Betaproteobacteria bacterium]